MPVRPSPYEVPLGGGVTGTGADYSRRQGGESVVKGGGSFPLFRDPTLAQTWRNLGTVVEGVTRAFKQRRDAELDNEVISNYFEVVVGVDEINRQLRQQDVRSGDYFKKWSERVGKLVDEVHQRASPEAQYALTKKVMPHLVEQRLKAKLVADSLLKDETLANVSKYAQLAEGQAANLDLPDVPLIPGSDLHAFDFLDGFDKFVDEKKKQGILTDKEATEAKQRARRRAYFARAERLAFDRPEEYLVRSLDPGDRVIANLDPNEKKQLDARAEARRDHRRSVRLSEETRQEKVVKESQDRWYGMVTRSMEEAYQRGENLEVFIGEVSNSKRFLGEENASKALAHLRVLQSADRTRGTATKKEGWDTGYGEILSRVLSGKASLSDVHAEAGITYDPTHHDELVRAWFGKTEDDRKDEIEANTSFIKSQLAENIGLIAKFNKRAALAEGRALREFARAIQSDRTIRGAKMDQYADELVRRYTEAIQTHIAKPEILLKTLPIVDGVRLETEELIIDAWKKKRILESQANEYLGIVRYVRDLPVSATQPSEGEEAEAPPPPEAKPGGFEGFMKKAFGGSKKTQTPEGETLRTPRSKP